MNMSESSPTSRILLRVGTAAALSFAGCAFAAAPIDVPLTFPAGHPRAAVGPTDTPAAIRERIRSDPTSHGALEAMQHRVDKYVERHATDPSWIVSRLQMYWKSHATEIFINGPLFDHAGGKAAPVPTVRFPGGRDSATAYAAPPLEEIPPQSEDPRGVYLINKRTGVGEWADPSKTGRTIDQINSSIMELAQVSATVYWATGDERYARFAYDLFDTYMMGMNYRERPIDLSRGHAGTIAGLSTFEVIQERILPGLASTYDFLHDYIQTRSPDKLPIYAATFKKWIDTTIDNGVPFNNWNLIEARFVLSVARVLDDDGDYPDRRGSHFYVDQILNHSSIRQWSLLDLLDRGFDANTGLWSECPGYSINVVGDFAHLSTTLAEDFGIDLVAHAPVVPKAVLATAQYLYPNGYTVAYGDSHYTRLSAGPALELAKDGRRHARPEQEALFTRFAKTIETINGSSKATHEGTLSPGTLELLTRTAFAPSTTISGGTLADFVTPTFHGPNASLFVQRNGLDPQTGLMAAQYASRGNHMHANGLALELYGRGIVLAPSGGIGTSYFQPDYAEYYSQFPAHNTVVVDGISGYPVMRSNHGFELLSCYPAPEVKIDVFAPITYAELAFLEPETNADQRRLTSIVRTSPTSGYYVDIFRSKRRDGRDKKHEYFYHNLGQELALADTNGHALALQSTQKLAFADGDLFAYDCLRDKRSAVFADDFRATFKLNIPGRDSVAMNVWIRGAPDREIFAVNAPPSRAFRASMIPDEIAALPLPTLVVQQRGEAWNHSFVAVYEPSSASASPSIAKIEPFFPANAPPDFVGFVVTANSGDVQRILACADDTAVVETRGARFRGTYAVISEAHGALQYLFLGYGKQLGTAEAELDVIGPAASAALSHDATGWKFTSAGPVTLVLSKDVLGSATSLKLDASSTPQSVTGRPAELQGKPALAFDLPAMSLTTLNL